MHSKLRLGNSMNRQHCRDLLGQVIAYCKAGLHRLLCVTGNVGKMWPACGQHYVRQKEE